MQGAQIKAAQIRRHTAVEQDQSKQQNETAEREINRHFPRGSETVARSPNTNEQKRRDERELVKCVEEKQIERRERAHRSGRDEKQARVKCVSMLRDLAGEPDGGESNERGEEQHHQAQSIDAESEIDVPVITHGKRRHHFVSAVRVAFEPEAQQQSRAECDSGRPQRGAPRRRAEENRQGGRYRKQNYKEQDHRKTVK